MVYIWWCWHICKGGGVEVDYVQLGEERKVFQCSTDTRMVLGVKYYFDLLWIGSSVFVGCVALWVSFSKCPRSLKSEFRAKRYDRFSVGWSVTRRWAPPRLLQRLVHGFCVQKHSFAPLRQVLFVWWSPDAWRQRFRARTSELWATDVDRVWCPSIRRVGCPVSRFGSSLYCVWWASDASVAESIAASVACEINRWFFNWALDVASRVCCPRISRYLESNGSIGLGGL
jgi:hypothetical protein